MSDLETEPKPSKRLWVCAGIVALALHLGGAALAVAHLRSDGFDDTLGANAVEIGILSSPHVEQNDLPLGPDTELSQASQQLNEQEAEVKQTDLPKDRPTETDEADRLVTQNNSEKPKEDDPKIAKVATAASPESVAQEETARQTLDEKAPEAEKARAPNLGIGKDKGKLTADWGRRISAYFKLHQRYPKVKKSQPVTVKVSLMLNRLGNVVQVSVLESSGYPAFDEEAISMIRRSDPVPRPPTGLTDDTFSFTMNVNFDEKK